MSKKRIISLDEESKALLRELIETIKNSRITSPAPIIWPYLPTEPYIVKDGTACPPVDYTTKITCSSGEPICIDMSNEPIPDVIQVLQSQGVL